MGTYPDLTHSYNWVVDILSFSFFPGRIPTSFNERKTTAAAAHLVSLAGGDMEFIRLLKLLYMADREAWTRYGRPISGDSYVSMDQGPVLSSTYDLIKETAQAQHAGIWSQTIQPASANNVKLSGPVDTDALSDAEIDILNETHDRFLNVPTWGSNGLIERLHQMLAEWKNPKGTSLQIRAEDILRAVGKADRIPAVRKDLKDFEAFRRLVGAR